MPLSLQCPRCNGAVSVADHAAGKRVKCPHCEQTFLAPGVTAAVKDDDDWLKLDDLPAVAPGKPIPTKATTSSKSSLSPATPQPKPVASPKSSGKVPALTANEEALLAKFATDLDEFTAEIEKPPAPLPSAPTVQPRGKSPLPVGVKPAAVSSPEYATEYRVNCNICGSMMYAKATQAGKTVKCGDCHSPLTIPPPPKVRKDTPIDMESAPTFQFENREIHRKADPYQKSADKLLEDAGRVESSVEPPNYDVPSVKAWLKNIFGIFKDLGVLAHWLGLSLIASVPVAAALTIDSDILKMGLFPGGLFLAVLTVSCGFAILQAVANNEETVSDWPTLDPLGWLSQLFVALAAAGVVAAPVWGLCHFTIGPELLSVAITMFAVYALFPFVLLSMLDMNTPFVPFSAEVARSLTKCEEAWGGFYFSSALLFIATFLTFTATASVMPPVGAIISIFVGIGATFCYFSMIGRLAYAIGQAVNAPPMKNDIDRTRPTDTY